VRKTELCFTEDIEPALLEVAAVEKHAWTKQPVLQMAFGSYCSYRRQLKCAEDAIVPGRVIVGSDLSVLRKVLGSAKVETVRAIVPGDVRPSTGQFQALGGCRRRKRQPPDQQGRQYQSEVEGLASSGLWASSRVV
jgi:hypothetical protein